MSKITPQGYAYGMDPKSYHPFWEDGGGGSIDEYLKDISAVVTEDEDGTTYVIKKTDQDDTISDVVSIFVSKTGTQPVIPTDYVTSVTIQKVEGETADKYYFTYYTKDGESHGMGTVDISKDYVKEVTVTGEETSGVNTITITVDGDEASFDTPTQYIKSATQSSGDNEEDLYTLTDESGHEVTIASPGQYVQSATNTVNSTAGNSTAEVSMRGVVGGSGATSRLVGFSLQDPTHSESGNYRIGISNSAGDTAELEWPAGGGNQNFEITELSDISKAFMTYNQFTFLPSSVHFYSGGSQVTGSGTIHVFDTETGEKLGTATGTLDRVVIHNLWCQVGDASSTLFLVNSRIEARMALSNISGFITNRLYCDIVGNLISRSGRNYTFLCDISVGASAEHLGATIILNTYGSTITASHYYATEVS